MSQSTETFKEFPPIKGFQEVSLVDWEGKIASIIFLGGCNLRCPFCHSSSLVLGAEGLECVPFGEIEHFLGEKRSWIDGIVITGGEPTLYEDKLLLLLKTFKEAGFLVKLDTNGTRPDMLQKAIGSKAIDYVAMDIKAPLVAQKYRKACGVEVAVNDILVSRDMIMKSGIDYEFRTTVVPGIIATSDILEIAKSIVPAKRYCLQQFVPKDTVDPAFLKIKPYHRDELHRMAAVASEYLPKVVIKNT